MTELERKILLQLLKDSDQPVNTIARKVGASRQTVAKHVARLKSDGSVKSVTANLNPERFGLKTKAYIFLREDPDAGLREKNNKIIRRLYQVTKFYRLFGRYSAVLEVLVNNSGDLSSLVKRIHGLKGVRETETLIVHSTVKNEPEAPFLHALRSKR
jgi:Lrp/AsnC family leucine-responsive transcriptional regulator